jgi:hypothetical protein
VLPLATQPGGPASRGEPSPATPKPKPPEPELPLQAAEPTEAQIQTLLEAWLAAKAAVLAGKAPAVAPSQLAVASLVAALDADRQSDLDRGESQTIEAKVTSLEIASRSPDQIEAKVTLLYGDERRSQAGKLIEQTPRRNGTTATCWAATKNSGNWNG